MHSSIILTTAALAGSTLAANFNVAVGNNQSQNVFTPDTIEDAKVGDTITFRFWPKAHSVVQAAFTDPCDSLDGGFYSPFVPTSDTSKVADTTYVYRVVNESAPIWFYCGQGRHCQSGMVGVINPPNPSTGRTLEAFREAASSVTENDQPADGTGVQGLDLVNISSATTSGSPTASGAAPTGSPTNAASSLEMNKGLAFTGIFGMVAYLFL